MNQLRRVLETIQKQLGKLHTTQRLLIGSLAVILVMTLFLVSLYAGRRDMVPLLNPGATPEDQARALAYVSEAGIPHTQRGGRLLVPADRQYFVLAQLGQTGRLPANTALLFDDLVRQKNVWMNSRQQNDQLYQVALQNTLARVISDFTGVRDATVIIDAPPPHGLGAARRPSAVATVFTESGAPIDQKMVDAVANLVAGAKAGLRVENVRVIDGTSGRQRTPTSQDALLPTTYLEHAAAVETQTRDKILDLLAYVPGVIVAVTAQVDVKQVSSQETRHLPEGAGSVGIVRKERTSTTADVSGGAAAEPGVRANQTADINALGDAGGARTDQSDEETEFEVAVGQVVEQTRDPRGMPTRLAASINVPRSYIAALIRQSRAAAGGGNAPADAEPTDQEVAARFEQERAEILRTVRPHVNTRTPTGDEIKGDVEVALIPVDVPGAPGSAWGGGAWGGPGGGSGGRAGGLLMVGGQLIQTVLVGGLAVVALGMMFVLVRRSTRPLKLPTPEEIVGVPPALQPRTEVVGEADESETPMAGIELDDTALRARKMLEQVSDLVVKSPDSAAKILNRWVTAEQ